MTKTKTKTNFGLKLNFRIQLLEIPFRAQFDDFFGSVATPKFDRKFCEGCTNATNTPYLSKAQWDGLFLKRTLGKFVKIKKSPL